MRGMVDSMFTAAFDELITAVVAMRHRAGLTQRQLADALGREQNYLGRIETGQRRVDLVELIQICRACKLKPADEIAAIVARIADRVPSKRVKRRPSR